MLTKILQLTIGSRDLSQAEMFLVLLQAEQNHKIHSIWFWVKKKSHHFESKIVLSVYSACNNNIVTILCSNDDMT